MRRQASNAALRVAVKTPALAIRMPAERHFLEGIENCSVPRGSPQVSKQLRQPDGFGAMTTFQ